MYKIWLLLNLKETMAMVGASNGEQYYAKGGLFWNLQTPASDWTGLECHTLLLVLSMKEKPYPISIFIFSLYSYITP